VRGTPDVGGAARHCMRMMVATAAMVSVTTVGTGMLLAPPAAADPDPNLQNAVASARGSACGPLTYDPVAEHAAEIVNRSTDEYISHTARNVPVDDVMPILKDLGSSAGKAVRLQGAGHNHNDVDAIKGVLLEGYKAIPDCAYTDFGVSLQHNVDTGDSIAVAILTGP